MAAMAKMETDVSVVDFTTSWIIKNFTAIQSFPGEYELNSGIFTIPSESPGKETKFRLSCLPNKIKEGCAGLHDLDPNKRSVQISVELVNAEETEALTYSVDSKLMDKDHKTILIKSTSFKYRSGSKVIVAEFDHTVEDKLLSDGKLQMLFQFRALSVSDKSVGLGSYRYRIVGKNSLKFISSPVP